MFESFTLCSIFMKPEIHSQAASQLAFYKSKQSSPQFPESCQSLWLSTHQSTFYSFDLYPFIPASTSHPHLQTYSLPSSPSPLSLSFTSELHHSIPHLTYTIYTRTLHKTQTMVVWKEKGKRQARRSCKVF